MNASGEDFVLQDRIFIQALDLFLPSSQEFLWVGVLPVVHVRIAVFVPLEWLDLCILWIDGTAGRLPLLLFNQVNPVLFGQVTCRITEPLRLEKIFKVIKPKHKPSITLFTPKPFPRYHGF